MSACTQYNETSGRTREVIGYIPSTAQEETECAGEGRERGVPETSRRHTRIRVRKRLETTNL